MILSLPKFKIESTVNLKEIIEKLGKSRVIFSTTLGFMKLGILSILTITNIYIIQQI